MNKAKKLIIVIALILAGYYMYLTSCSQIYQISGTFIAEEEYSSIVLKFDENRLSVYAMLLGSDDIVSRMDYKVAYQKYNRDVLGTFWSLDGHESFALNGSDVAGFISAKPIGMAILRGGNDNMYFDESEIREVEEDNNIQYSFKYNFSIKGDILKFYDGAEIVFQKSEELPAIEAELTRLIDSLIPKES